MEVISALVASILMSWECGHPWPWAACPDDGGGVLLFPGFSLPEAGGDVSGVGSPRGGHRPTFEMRAGVTESEGDCCPSWM